MIRRLTLHVVVLLAMATAVHAQHTFAFPVYGSVDQYFQRQPSPTLPPITFGEVDPTSPYQAKLAEGFYEPDYDANGNIVGTILANGDGCCTNYSVVRNRGALVIDFGLQDSPTYIKHIEFDVRVKPTDVNICLAEKACTQVNSSTDWTHVSLDGPGAELTIQTRRAPETSWFVRLEIRSKITFDTYIPKPGAPLVFLPGIAGSELSSGGLKYWIPTLSTALLYSNLSLDPSILHPDMTATDVVPQYGSFLTFLQGQGYPRYYIFSPGALNADCPASPDAKALEKPRLFVFPYDWRRSNADSAQQLSAYLQCVQRWWPDQQAIILAHSMGGLVARRALLTDSAAAGRVKQVITMGTPYYGASKAEAALLNGTFLDGFKGTLARPFIKFLMAYYPGAHELLPSRKLWPTNPLVLVDDVAQPPTMTTPGYDDGMAFFDSQLPSLPGTANRNFHDAGSQDDLSVNPVPLLQFVGILPGKQTIVRVIHTRTAVLKLSSLNLFRYQKETYTYGSGDGTVPLESAAAPANTIPVEAEHGAIPNEAGIQVLDAIAAADPQTQSTSSPLRLAAMAFRAAPATTAPVESTYVTIDGTDSVTVTDSAGNVSQNGDTLPGAQVDAAGDVSWSMALDITKSYRIEFTATDAPFAIQTLVGESNENPHHVVRYNDVSLPAGAKVQFNVTATTTELKVDANQDGIFETTIAPTVVFDGTAPDLTPPVVTFRGGPRVAIDATDASGIAAIRYSTNGTDFHPYTGSFLVDRSASPVVYAFADDRAGNRSLVAAYTVPATSSLTTLSVSASNGEYATPLTVRATLLDSADAPLPNQLVTFQFGTSTASATTDANGVATATLTPTATGTTTIYAAFAGVAGHDAASASATITVRVASTHLVMTSDSDFIGEYESWVTLKCRLTATTSGNPLPGQQIRFSLGTQSATGMTGDDGIASARFLVTALPGIVVMRVDFSTTATYGGTSNIPFSFPIEPTSMQFLYTGPDTVFTGHAATFTAQLIKRSLGAPLPNAPVTMQIGDRQFTAVTDANGVATINTTVTEPPPYTILSFTFAGDANRASTLFAVALNVRGLETRLALTAPTFIGAGTTQQVQVQLSYVFDGSPVAGKTVTLSLGTTSASAVTDAQGNAVFTLNVPASMPLGQASMTVTFGGDDSAQASSASLDVNVVQATSFVIWGGNTLPPAPGDHVTFLSPDWGKQVTSGDYQAANEFLGYAKNAVALQPCQADARTSGNPALNASCWSVKSGEAKPPATPGGTTIELIVATSIGKANGTIYGNIAALAVVVVDSQSTANLRTGTIVEVITP